MTCPDPPEHPFIANIDDEIDVDLADDDPPVPQPDPNGARPEPAEYLGSYDSIAAFLRAALEPEVSPACVWILEHLDYQAIQSRWERDGSRLLCEHGHIYRRSAPITDEQMPTS